jgi:FMN phosphatase YigB (HAD superfamily)
LKEKRLRLACLSNGPVEWSRLLRQRFGMDAYIETWVVSGAVRCEKPEERILPHPARENGADPARCLYADDNPRNLPPRKARHDDLLFRGEKSEVLFQKLLGML